MNYDLIPSRSRVRIEDYRSTEPLIAGNTPAAGEFVVLMASSGADDLGVPLDVLVESICDDLLTGKVVDDHDVEDERFANGRRISFALDKVHAVSSRQ